jgi:hypothetical protein
MPTSAYSEGGKELSRHNSLEDQRALQVELFLLGQLFISSVDAYLVTV